MAIDAVRQFLGEEHWARWQQVRARFAGYATQRAARLRALAFYGGVSPALYAWRTNHPTLGHAGAAERGARCSCRRCRASGHFVAVGTVPPDRVGASHFNTIDTITSAGPRAET